MISFKIFGLLLLATSILSQSINDKKFPKEFLFGIATSAYQIEGGWNADGKGENIWDHITHVNPDFVKNRENGDVACDSYQKYKDDVQMLKFLGVHHYRFSISWSRILPTGYANKINTAGVKYYRNLINELKANNIEPMITLYHWDLPQPLQDIGGWTNPLVIDYFVDYARICFELFGDSIKYWMTFNEPKQICHWGYGIGIHAPGIKSPHAEFLCTHHVLLSHAHAWHLYDKTFRKSQNGKVGFVIDSQFFQPETNKTEDVAAAETSHQFTFGWFANPLMNGDYPAVMKEHMSRRSKAAGFKKSILPEFSSGDKRLIKGTLDFLGVNLYTANVARAITNTTVSLAWEDCIEAYLYQPSTWKKSVSDIIKITPWAMRGLLNWINNTYYNIPILITENGVGDSGVTLNDDVRVDFIKTYMSSLRDAMEYDGVNVFGYTYWGLLDALEWSNGYSEPFGLIHVDFSSPNRTRTPKRSAHYYKNIIETRCLLDKCKE